MKIKKVLLLLLILTPAYLLGSMPEKASAPKLPFGDALIMHISGKYQDNPENIWFSIQSIEETDENVRNMSTNFDTKKLEYDSKTKSLYIIGKKPLSTSFGSNLSFLKPEETKQIITAHAIVKPKNTSSTQHTKDCDPEATLQTNETDSFCKKIAQTYKNTVKIILKREQKDRSCVVYNDYETDNFPSIGKPMNVYFNPLTYRTPANQQVPTEPLTPHDTDTPTTVKKSFFSFNKIIALGCASLISYLLIQHFFEINIDIKLKQT